MKFTTCPAIEPIVLQGIASPKFLATSTAAPDKFFNALYALFIAPVLAKDSTTS